MKRNTIIVMGILAILLISGSLVFGVSSFSSPGDTVKVFEKELSEWVFPDGDGNLVYKRTPKGDRIMDFSHAGYMGGGVALPDVAVHRTVQPSGGADDTQFIQDAIDEVADLPLKNGFRGAVELAPGTFTCAGTIEIPASGIVLRGSGSGEGGTIIKMVGDRHTAIEIGLKNNNRHNLEEAEETDFLPAETRIIDAYVPSGAMTFRVADATGFEKGDMIEIRKPITTSWIRFMEMHDLVRDGKPQTWMPTGSTIDMRRYIADINDNEITVEVPLSDNFDAEYLNPPGTEVVRVSPPALVSQVGVEYLRIQAPPMEMSYQQAPYKAMRIKGKDCWARDIGIEETMNSVNVSGRQITLERVVITRTVPNLGASKPAEFAPNGTQILLDRCSSTGDNIWHVATGGGHSGPIVLLNCAFGGNGRIEGHQRWTTGMLVDNCRAPQGGIDFRNRGAMGSGHGWGTGWSVAWNSTAKNYIIQAPPGTRNWLIGSSGTNVPTPRPFDQGPILPLGISDSPGEQVVPQSLYLAQLEERLGPEAVENIGYSVSDANIFSYDFPQIDAEHEPVINKVLGENLAAYKYANPSNIRGGELTFGGERALDGDPQTYWSTDDNITSATLEVDLEVPQVVNTVEIREAEGLENRVRAYKFEGMVDSKWVLLSEGKTIGRRKVDRFLPVMVWKIKLTLEGNASPAISNLGLYLQETSEEEKRVSKKS